MPDDDLRAIELLIAIVLGCMRWKAHRLMTCDGEKGMTDPVGKRGTSFAVFTPVMVALLVGLGVWQLQRRVEQQALIAALNERLAAAPVPLPDPTRWAALTSEKDEFRRVSFTAIYESRLDATVYSSDTSMRDDISGPGDWAFIPARLPNGDTVAVDVGFVPNTTQDRNQQDRVVAQLITNKPVNLTGYLRFPVATGLFTPNVEHDKQLWFTRDHRAGARVGSGCAVLHRSGGASAAERHPETRAASAARARQPHAICHHLLFAGRLAADRICCPAARWG